MADLSSILLRGNVVGRDSLPTRRIHRRDCWFDNVHAIKLVHGSKILLLFPVEVDVGNIYSLGYMCFLEHFRSGIPTNTQKCLGNIQSRVKKITS